MNVQLVCSKSSLSKSTYLYNMAWSRAKSGKKTILLVPEQYTLEAELALLEVAKDSIGMIEIQVMSITRLTNWIFSSVKKPSATMLDDIGKTLLIKSILRKHSDELTLFDRVATMPGFSASVSDLIGDLKKFAVNVDELLEATKDADRESSFYKKTNDIAKIISYYQKANEKIDAIDADDSIDVLCDILDEASPKLKSFFADTSIYIDSFDYIPAKNVQLIFSLLPHVDEIAISITVDKERSDDLFAAGIDSIISIENMADSLGVDVDYKYLEQQNKNKDASIVHLQEYLFSYPAKKYEKECNITITKALGKNEEVEHVAASILELVGSGKYIWSDIGVVCSSLDRYASYISRVFKQYQVPYFLDERRNLASHPIVVWLLSSLQFCQIHTREHMLNMIKTLYTPLSGDDCEELEDYCIANSIQGSMFARDFRRGAKKYDLAKLNAKRKDVMDQIKAFDTNKKNAIGWAKEIYKLLESANIQGIVNKERVRLERAGRLDEAAETGQSYNVVIKILDQLHAIASDDLLDIDDVVELLEESFLDIQIGVLPTGINNVLVGDVGRSKMSNIKCTYILGANEGLLPTPMPEGAIFGEVELEQFKQRGVVAGRDSDFRKSESNYNLYTALISPNERLHISFDCTDGKECALIIEKIKSLFPNILVDNVYIDPMISPAAAFLASAKALGAIGDSRPVKDGTWRAGLAALMNDEKYASQIEKMYDFAAGGNIQQEIMQSKNGNLVASISQIEQYAKCPFAYMISYGLQPEDDPSSKIEHVSSGAFLHKVMEEFGREISDTDIYKLSDDEIDIMMQKKAKHIAKVFDDGAFSIDAQSEFLSHQLIETARRGAKVYVKGVKNSEFKPVAHEMVFDLGRDFGPISIDLPNGKKILLRGKIDRVDEYQLGDEKWIRAIDYKSGRKSIDLSGLMTGENLQLFIYANALTEKSASRAAGVFYFPLRNDYTDEGKDRSDVEKLDGVFMDNAHVVKALDTTIDAGQKSQIVNIAYKNDNTPKRSKALKTVEYFDAALKASMSTAKTLCSMMDAGEMPVNPIVDKASSACSFCDYSNICRFGAQVYTQNQKPTDDKVEKYINSFIGGDSDEVD